MEKIAILTDSSCDLSDELLKAHNIKFLPLKIIYKDREYDDRVGISADEVYSGLKTEVPTTSLPSPEYTANMLKNLADEGFTHILGIFISSGLSGTFNMVRNVTTDFKEAAIELIDSKSLSLGLGFPVLEAAKDVEEGLKFEDIITRTKAVCEKTKAFYVIKTLEYLKKGGRIGKVEGTIGDILNIKPIISVNEEGVYYTVKKVRGRKKSIAELIEIVQSYKGKNIRVGVLNGDAKVEGLELYNVIKEIDHVEEVYFEQISPVLTVHTGPGLLGVIVQEL